MTIPLIVVLAVMGALLGSFGCAQVWRLRAKQLLEDKQEYEKRKALGEHPKRDEYYDPQELANLRVLLRSVKHDRSECLSCHHQLAWYDLIPVFSWLSLGGKCRYCRQSIGSTELVAELGLSVLYVVSFLAWPHALTSLLDISVFVCWLLACLIMLVLFIYDAKWSLLPFAVNMGLIIVAVLFCLLQSLAYGFNLPTLVGAIVLLSGLYIFFALFRWAGFGDGILGLGLALLLGQWQLAFLTLFLANILGCLMLIPLSLRGKLHRGVKVPFGPFMIVGAVIAMLWGDALIAWFSTATSGLFMALML